MSTSLFCSLADFTIRLQNYLIPCPFKKLTGIDCPGCGFQRSVIALIKGDFSDSLHLYPAAIPFILTALFLLVDMKLQLDRRGRIKKTLFIITGNIIMFSYVFHLYNIYR